MDLFSRTCLDLGSSFILIKKDWLDYQLYKLVPGLSLLLFFYCDFRSLSKIPKENGSLLRWLDVWLYSGFSFRYSANWNWQFCNIDTNSLTPLNTLVLGALVLRWFWKKTGLGCFNWTLGSFFSFQCAMNHPNQNYYYAILVIIASICYAVNVNLIKSFCQTWVQLASQPVIF
jgi:hypothetical protein